MVVIDINGTSFPISLFVMPIAGFDIVIGIDWLSKQNAEIVCSKKIIKIPLSDGSYAVACGERRTSEIPSISIMKAIDDIRVVSEYPNVFPDKLPGLPPVRDVEYQIDLVPGATPVARSP